MPGNSRVHPGRVFQNASEIIACACSRNAGNRRFADNFRREPFRPAILRLVADETPRWFEIENLLQDRFAACVNNLKTKSSARFDSLRKKTSGIARAEVNVPRDLIRADAFRRRTVARTRAKA